MKIIFFFGFRQRRSFREGPRGIFAGLVRIPIVASIRKRPPFQECIDRRRQ